MLPAQEFVLQYFIAVLSLALGDLSLHLCRFPEKKHETLKKNFPLSKLNIFRVLPEKLDRHRITTKINFRRLW